jgi:hypothetical protein
LGGIEESNNEATPRSGESSDEYISEKDIKKRVALMKYIDTELMMMVSMCRIDDMEF